MGRMTPRERKQIESEAEFLSTLNHPNIIKYYGTCLEQKTIVMEKMGLTLNTATDSDSQCTVNNLREYLNEKTDEVIESNIRIKIALDAAKGLEHLHLNGLVHRDLKSSNLLLKEMNDVITTKVGHDIITITTTTIQQQQ